MHIWSCCTSPLCDGEQELRQQGWEECGRSLFFSVYFSLSPTGRTETKVTVLNTKDKTISSPFMKLLLQIYFKLDNLIPSREK